MTRQTKRAQVEAMGWKLTALPRRVEAGLIRDSRTGYVSAAFDDYKRPAGWIVTAPAERNLPPRQFDNASPIPAVRWAYDQAMTPQAPVDVGGVAGLALLMASAGKSGVVAERGEEPSFPARPDAELLSLCHDIAGCARIADPSFETNPNPSPWDQPVAFKAWRERTAEARRTRDRIIPRVVELEATTTARVLAKALAVVQMFNTASGARTRAVRALVKDLERVLGKIRP